MSNDALPFIFDCLASKNSRMQQKKQHHPKSQPQRTPVTLRMPIISYLAKTLHSFLLSLVTLNHDQPPVPLRSLLSPQEQI